METSKFCHFFEQQLVQVFDYANYRMPKFLINFLACFCVDVLVFNRIVVVGLFGMYYSSFRQREMVRKEMDKTREKRNSEKGGGMVLLVHFVSFHFVPKVVRFGEKAYSFLFFPFLTIQGGDSIPKKNTRNICTLKLVWQCLLCWNDFWRKYNVQLASQLTGYHGPQLANGYFICTVRYVILEGVTVAFQLHSDEPNTAIVFVHGLDKFFTWVLQFLALLDLGTLFCGAIGYWW